jgi:hypothetical protein
MKEAVEPPSFVYAISISNFSNFPVFALPEK